jgi:hypothetical protein
MVVYDRDSRESPALQADAAADPDRRRDQPHAVAHRADLGDDADRAFAALALFGGEAIGTFALTLLFGVAIGTISSIYIAGPVLILFRLQPERYRPGKGGKGPAPEATGSQWLKASKSGRRTFPGRAPIDAYGNGGFRFADMSHRGSILCLPSGIHGWDKEEGAALTVADLQRVLDEAGEIEVLLVGTGKEIRPLLGGDQGGADGSARCVPIR